MDNLLHYIEISKVSYSELIVKDINEERNNLNQKEMSEFIQFNSEINAFTGGVSDEIIKEVEKALKVKFSDSYIWFLENYGSGGLFGVDILGCGKSATPSVITNTERFRNIGLPTQYVVVENCEEFVYCLDTGNLIDAECVVVSWDRTGGYSGKRADNFYEFLTNRLLDAKENWDENF